jgi:uncharacterized protein YjiK
MKRLALLLGTVTLCFGFLFMCSFDTSSEEDRKKEKEANRNDENEETVSGSATVQVLHVWEVPAVLKEISGIVYYGPDRFICIQDESGTLFIYSTQTAAIEKEISFGDPGDYEGVTLVGKTAYVVRSDGTLFEISTIDSAKPKVSSFSTPLTSRQNIEGLCYEPKQNRLLLSVKGEDPNSKAYKGIYAFDLKAKTLATAPVFKIDLTDPVFESIQTKKKNARKGVRMEPSDIAVHPHTGLIYVLDAAHSLLITMNAESAIQSMYHLPGKAFSQPEGLAFSPSGDLFISNEGKKESGNIIQVEIGSGK